MKKIIKSIIFILIFSLLWHYIFSILWLPKNTISRLYDETENSLDIIYIGGSNAHHHFNPMLAYDLYGFSVYLLSSGIQPFPLTKYLISESQKSQKPILYVIDIARLQDNFTENYFESWSRYVVDAMKPSKSRIEAINYLLKSADIPKGEYINYYFSFLKYHNLWKSVNQEHFYKGMFKYRDYYFYEKATNIVQQEQFKWNDEILELPPKNKEVLLDLIDYIETNNINVLFVIPNTTFWSPGNQWLNDAVSIIEQHNMDIINFNKIENEMNIDWNTDFYDANHLNVYGATKYTLYFSKYLKEHYNLPNHKGDNRYSLWENEYKKFKDEFQIRTGQSFDDLLSGLNFN